MAIPPLGSSLACTGITVSVHNQTLSGETALASRSDPVATVATRTFSEAGSALPSSPVLPVSLTAGAGAQADATSLPPPESGTVPRAPESTSSKQLNPLLESDEICEKIFEQFLVTRSCSQAVNSIQVLVIKKLNLQIPRPALCKVLMAGRTILLGKEQKKSCYVDVAQTIIHKVGKGRLFKVVPTTLSEILERSPNARRAIKAGVEADKLPIIILDEVTAILKEDGLPSISDSYFKVFVLALKVVLRGQRHEIEQKLKNRDFRTLYAIAKKIAEMDTSSAPKRARETSDVLSEAGAGAGGENISSQASGSRGTQEERASKRARKTSSDLPPSQLQPVPDETRTRDSQSAEDSRRHTAEDPSELFDGDGHRPEVLISIEGRCASGVGERDVPLTPFLLAQDSGSRGTPSDVFLHDDPYAELFGAEDGANGGDFVGLLGDNDFADSFSIEDSSASAGQ